MVIFWGTKLVFLAVTDAYITLYIKRVEKHKSMIKGVGRPWKVQKSRGWMFAGGLHEKDCVCECVDDVFMQKKCTFMSLPSSGLHRFTG